MSVKKFIIAFFVTVSISLIIVGGVHAAVTRIIRPPEVGRYVVMQFSTTGGALTTTLPQENIFEGLNLGISQNICPSLEKTMEVVFERRPNFYTFLIYGLDDGNNADTIMVAAFDGNTRNAYIIGLTRDMRVDVDRAVGRSKLVASYAAGRANGGGHEGGISRLKYEVSTLIGFQPDFYMSVRYAAFVRLINAIGGVQIHVPFHMYYSDPCQDLFINIPAGTQRLNGQQALNFARFRQGNEGHRGVTDFQRMSNQQAVISAAVDEILSPRTITRIPELLSIYRDNVITDLDYGELAWFANDIRVNGLGTLYTYNLPSARTERRGWYEIPDKEGILELVNRTINPFTIDITAEMVRIVE